MREWLVRLIILIGIIIFDVVIVVLMRLFPDLINMKNIGDFVIFINALAIFALILKLHHGPRF
tara:strand:- start:845 stop:1033 length:189 start_codon:yes stop_codon:yes gene_type:complete